MTKQTLLSISFVSDENNHLTHPVKNPSPCHIEDLGGGVLTVLLSKQGHLQLEEKGEGGGARVPTSKAQ